MDKYLANLIPCVKRFSKDLNKNEVFVDKSGLLLIDNQHKYEYMFMRDGQQLFSGKGKVQRGSWKLFANGKQLVDRAKDDVLLENVFVDDAVLLLEVIGAKGQRLILVDEQNIADFGVVGYLNRKAAKKVDASFPEIEIDQQSYEGLVFVPLMLQQLY